MRTGASARLRRISRTPVPPHAGAMAAPAPPSVEAALLPTFPPAPAEPGIVQPTAPGEAVNAAEFGAILARRWRLILATTALTTALATTLAFVMSPRYMAKTSIFVDPRTAPAFQTENPGQGGAFDPNLVDSLTMVIESETVLKRVVAAENLAADPEFGGNGSGDKQVNALLALKEAVKAKRPERTYVVEVQVRTREAQKSARLANAIARAYLSDGSDVKSATVTREQGWLDKHLAQLEKRLREAEARVDQYRTKNQIFGAEGKLVGEQQLSDINRSLADAQRKAAEAKATLDQVEMLRRSGKLPDASTEALRSTAIERLRAQQTEVLRLEANSRSTLGPRHPASLEVREQLVEVQRQINAELVRIAENARSSHAVARANVQGLERELERLKKSEGQTNHTLLGLRELERAVEAQKTVYQKFLRDKEQIARLSVETPPGRIIQVAEPPNKPVSPNRPLFMALGLVGGMFMGVGLALVMESMAGGRGAGAAAARSGSPFAGAASGGSPFAGFLTPAVPLHRLPVPRAGLFGWRRSRSTLESLLAEPQGAYARAVAKLAEALWGPQGPAPASLLVSGAGAGHANPALVLGLGLALARLGHGVVLVDGHGGEGSLTARLAAHAQPVEAVVAGKRQRALDLGAGLPGALCLLPFAPVARGAGPARVVPASITLIDGPGLDTPAFAALDLENAIAGVLAVLSDDSGRARHAAKKRLGPALLALATGEG